MYITDKFLEMKREYTATVYIVQDEKVLLIFHKKLKKWLPPGGHLEENELPTEGAIREAFEETGLQIKLIAEENVWIEKRFNCQSMQRPYLCLVENLPQIGNMPPHQHIDLIYVGEPIGGNLKLNDNETDDVKWFSINEIEDLEDDIFIFGDTKVIACHILKEFFILTSYKSHPSYLT